MNGLLDAIASGADYEKALTSVYGMTPGEWDSRWRGTVRARSRPRMVGEAAAWVIPITMFIALTLGYWAVRKRRRRQFEEEAKYDIGPEVDPPDWWPKEWQR